jgi:SAM-dependent methyltransferase
MPATFSALNASKANFDDIYVMPDPRGYFSVLGSLDYMIPDIAEPIIRQILEAWCSRHTGKPRVLDVGCSYGINAAVHRLPVTFATLRRRYSRREMAALDPQDVARLDRNYYAGWPDNGLASFVGLDVSRPAITYAKEVGLIEDGIVADLERSTLNPEAARIVESVDVILSTGCVGYVTEKTFSSLIGATQRPPWIISFVLRLFPYDRLAAVFASHGLVTEKLSGTLFAQRRFRDLEEFERTLGGLGQLGINTDGFESEGLLQAELYLSRPAADVRAMPLADIVTVTSGRNRPAGARYVKIHTNEGQRVALEP